MEDQIPAGLVPVTDPNLIAQLEQPQSKINEGNGGGRPQTREGEDKANAFLIRALGANRSYEGTGVGPRSLVGQTIADVAPNALNSLPGFIGNSPERQVADTTQDEFIAASLRQDSGAAIPPEEMERQRRIYFPMPGDSPQVIDAKRQARIRAIEGLVASAGRAVSPDLSAKYPEYFGRQGGAAENGAPPVAGANPGSSGGGSSPPTGPLQISRDGSKAFETDKDRAFGVAVQKAFDRGASKAELNALAVSWGYSPYGADLDAAVTYRDKGGKNARILPPQTGYQGPSLVGTLAASPFGAYAAGAANALTAGNLDEIAGLAGGDPAQVQQAKEVMRDAYPVASFVGETTGGALAMAGVNRVPALAGRALLADVGYGAAYGAGENNDNRLVGAAVGAAAGAAGNRLADRLSRGLRGAGAVPADRQAGIETAEAARRIGVDVLPADVGGPTTRRLTGAAAQGPLSAQPVVSAARRAAEQAQGVRDKVAAKVGTALEAEAAGEAARKGAQTFIERTSKQGRELYDKARVLSDGVRVPLTNAQQVVQRNIAELQEVPGGTEAVAVMEGLAGEMGGEWTADGIRSMRTTLRDRFIGEGLRGSDLERRVNQVIDAASKDIEDGLTQAGRPGAAQAYRAADEFWKQRLRTIDKVLQPIIGKDADRAPADIIKAIETAAQRDSAKMGTFIRSLPQEEQGIVRATLISRMGQVGAGGQDATGTVFSLGQFLTHWNQLTPAAKRTLFDDESRAALSDLARVAQGTKEAQRYANSSNSAGGMVGQIALSGGIGTVGGVPGLAVATAAQYVSGRLLASPRIARFLARPPKTEAQVRPWIDRLERIARAEPVIASEALGLQQQLIRAFGESTPARIAAEERGDERGRVSVSGQQNEQRGVAERLQ